MSNTNVKTQAMLASCRAMCNFLHGSTCLSESERADIQRVADVINILTDANDPDCFDKLLAIHSFLVEMKDIVKLHQNRDLMEIMSRYAHVTSQHMQSLYVHTRHMQDHIEVLRSCSYDMKHHSEALYEHGRIVRNHHQR